MAVAVGVAAVAIAAAVVIGAGRGEATRAATVKRKFPVALKVSVSLSPDGKRVSLASPDQLVVRELDGRASWTRPLAPDDGVERAVFVGDDVHYALRSGGEGRLMSWTPETGASAELRVLGDAHWLGHVDGGELVQEVESGGGARLYVVGDGGRRELMRTSRRVEVWAIAPDRRRLAFLDDTAFDGRIAIVDVATAAVVRSETIVEVTGLAAGAASHRRRLVERVRSGMPRAAFELAALGTNEAE